MEAGLQIGSRGESHAGFLHLGDKQNNASGTYTLERRAGENLLTLMSQDPFLLCAQKKRRNAVKTEKAKVMDANGSGLL